MQSSCSENKGADQLCGYRAAALRLLLLHMQKRFSHDADHIVPFIQRTTDIFIRHQLHALCYTKVFHDAATIANKT